MQETAERNGGQSTLISSYYRGQGSDDAIQMLISGFLVILLSILIIAIVVYTLFFIRKCFKAQNAGNQNPGFFDV